MGKSVGTSLGILVFASLVAIACGTDPVSPTAVEYARFNGEPVQLVVDHNSGDVALQIRYGDDVDFEPGVREARQDFLTKEAKRLASGRKEPLGATGISFTLTGGYPLQESYLVNAHQHGRYEFLTFAQNGRVKGPNIYARGARTKQG